MLEILDLIKSRNKCIAKPSGARGRVAHKILGDSSGGSFFFSILLFLAIFRSSDLEQFYG